MSDYRPKFMLINWSRGEVVGSGDYDEVRDQLKKCADGTAHPDARYIIAEVKVLSEMKRIES